MNTQDKTVDKLSLSNKLEALFRMNGELVEVGKEIIFGVSLSKKSPPILQKMSDTKGWLSIEKKEGEDTHSKGFYLHLPKVDVWEVMYMNGEGTHQPLDGTSYLVSINRETEELHPSYNWTGAWDGHLIGMSAVRDSNPKYAQDILNYMKDKIGKTFQYNLG